MFVLVVLKLPKDSKMLNCRVTQILKMANNWPNPSAQARNSSSLFLRLKNICIGTAPRLEFPFASKNNIVGQKNEMNFELHLIVILTEARCERCLLITESPKTPGHYRCLIWVLVCIPYKGLAVFSFAISRVPVYTAISNFFKFLFSTLQSRSCWQLTNSCLLRGFEGLLLWIDILSILLPIWCIFEVVCWVFSTLNVLVRLSIHML